MACIKHIIHQNYNGIFIQLVIVGEVYIWQVVVALLFLDVIERGMGRTDQVAVTVYIQPLTQVIGDIIRITRDSGLAGYGNEHHPLAFRLGNGGENGFQLVNSIVYRFLRTVFLHLMGKAAQLLTTLPYSILAQRIDLQGLYSRRSGLPEFCLLLSGHVLTCLPVDVMLFKVLPGGKDDFVILCHRLTIGIIIGHIDQPFLIIHTLLVGIHHLLHELLTLLAQGKLRFHLRVADHHVTVPMATAYIAAIAPAACVGHLTHLADADKRIGITLERHLMITSFLGELIRQLLGLGDIAGCLIKTLLNLLLQHLQLSLQSLQVIFLSPRLSCDTLIFGNILLELLVTFLILCHDTWNTLQGLYAIAYGTQAVVLAHGQMTVVMFIEVVALHIEAVTGIDLLPHLLIVHVDGVHHQRESIDLTHLAVLIADGTPGILQGGTHSFHVIGPVCRKLLDLRHRQSWQGSPVLTLLDL